MISKKISDLKDIKFEISTALQFEPSHKNNNISCLQSLFLDLMHRTDYVHHVSIVNVIIIMRRTSHAGPLL